MLDNLKTDDKIKQDGDSLGGYLLDTDAYGMMVDMAYIDKSAGGAMSLNVVLKGKDGKSVRQTWWMTSGDKKGNKNYYEKDGNKNYLPGFSAANNFAKVVLGKDISDVETEAKVLSLYSAEHKKEVPTEKQVIVEMLNKDVIVGVEKQIVDKTAKTDQLDANNRPIYKPTGETRQVNEITKSFRASDKLSAAEIRAELTDSVFLGKWITKFQGVTADHESKESKKLSGGAGATSGAPSASGETVSLFP